MAENIEEFEGDVQRMNRITAFINDLKDFLYWHIIFPHLKYTKLSFRKIKTDEGIAFIRNKKAKKE